jgi:hypothetical protein
MKTKKQLIKETLDHYDRMIEWAEKQDENGYVDIFKMRKEIGEDWGGLYCPLCIEFNLDSCHRCYFIKKYKRICCHLGWNDMYGSKTWGEWLVHAKKMRKIIRGL